MNELFPKQFVVNERQETIAVQLDWQTYQKIEEVLENYGLCQLMQDSNSEGYFSLEDAKSYYQSLKTPE